MHVGHIYAPPTLLMGVHQSLRIRTLGADVSDDVLASAVGSAMRPSSISIVYAVPTSTREPFLQDLQPIFSAVPPHRPPGLSHPGPAWKADATVTTTP